MPLQHRHKDRLQLPAELDSLSKFIAFAAARARETGFSSQRIREVELVLEEALVNVMEYAYPGQSGMVTLVARSDTLQRLVLEIRDRGELFNPLQREDPDVQSELMERPVGGLGIFLMKQLADGLSWQRQGIENCLIITFKGRHDR